MCIRAVEDWPGRDRIEMTVVPGTSGMIKEAEEHVRAGFRISMAGEL